MAIDAATVISAATITAIGMAITWLLGALGRFLLHAPIITRGCDKKS